MSGKRIFLTGSDNLIGNRCLILALQQSYNVIASVPSPQEANTVRRGFSPLLSPDEVDNLTFVIIPDLSAPNCFDDHLSEVDYIIHTDVAPNPTTASLAKTLAFISPTINSLLSAARASKTVQKVVVCSPAATPASPRKSLSSGINTVPLSHPPTLNATAQPLPFDLISILSSTPLGRFEPATTPAELLASSSLSCLAAALGQTIPSQPASCVHVEDLARMSLDVLNMATSRSQTFTAGVPVSFNQQIEIVRQRFPEAVARGVFPCDGNVPDQEGVLDMRETRETEEFFGWKFKSFEDMIIDVAGQYLELTREDGK
jgi:nucleoside-diphosphate-sugar epimerase